jgi:hypothetical protein
MRKHGIALGAAIVVMALSGAAAQASTGSIGAGLPPPSTAVRSKPITGTPHFSVTSSPIEQVRQLVQCGDTMYAVGSFSHILQGSHTYTRHNAFSFRATAPFTMTSWAPNVNGQVNSIGFRTDKCSRAYIGGSFTSVNGTAAKNIAAVNTTTSALVTTFGHNASAAVNTVRALSDHILVGGEYTSINGSSANPYMTSLDPTNGHDDGFVHLKISGHYQFKGVAYNATKIYNQALSHSGTLDMVMGDFTSVGGVNRQQIFMLNVGGSQARVTGWTSKDFNSHCVTTEPFYVQAASWSPGDSRIYIATTGRNYYNRPPNTFPLKGLCDVAAAFPATQKSVFPLWKNYTGCDTLRSTAADTGTAYFGGHERWSMNPDGCNFQGPGPCKGGKACPATGMEGLSPANGDLYVNSANTAGYYEHSRGLGADDMLVTKAGLWIASDNEGHSQTCGFVSGLSGICFLPHG